MKKTLVAVAAMAAVTGAMAEVTISGFVDKAVNITTLSNSGAKTTSRAVGPNAIGQDQITFAASEDLGDGMTAYTNISVAPNIGTAGLAGDVGQVGIKGGFGNLRIGSDYSTLWYTLNMSDASGWGAGAGNVHNVGNSSNEPNTSVIIYSLPSFAQGLNITVASRAGGNGNGAGNATAYLINYTTGGLSAQYAGATVTTPGTWIKSSNLGSGNNYGTFTEAATGNTKGNALAVNYDLGMLKIHTGYASDKNTGSSNQNATSYTYGISAPVGAFSLGLAFSNANYKSTTTTAGVKENGYRLLAKYSLSKRTSLYLQNGKATQSGNSNSAAGTGFGITHSF